MIKKLLITLLVAVTAYAGDVSSWAGRSGFQYLNRPFGVATISRGGAGGALLGSFNRWYNPAIYGYDTLQSIEFELSREGDEFDRTSAAFDASFHSDDLFWGVEGSNHIEGGIYTTGDFGTVAPTMDENDLKWQSSEFSLYIGRVRTEHFIWSFTSGMAFDMFDNESAYAILFGGGVAFPLFDKKLLLGLSALNWGFATPMVGDGNFGKGEKLPSTVRVGVGSNIPLKFGRVSLDLDALYHHVYDTLVGVSENLGDRVSYPLGVEYSPVEWVELRVGKEFNSGSSVINWGAGFNTDWVDLDIGFVMNSYDDVNELNWMANLKFHIYTPRIREVDPYSDHKRAVYRPSSKVEPKTN